MMMTKTKQKLTQPNYKEGELGTLISARIRLTDEERYKLKQAYYNRKRELAPVVEPTIGGSTIGVSHAINSGDNLDQQLGMSHIVVVDLLSSRDSIHLPLILKLQKVLEVEIVDKKRVVEACEGYWDYLVWRTNATP